MNKQLIYDAVCYLQGRDPDKAKFRNDVGFSKADSQVGHIAANLPFTEELWTDELTAEIAAVLVKYINTQLVHAFAFEDAEGDAIRAIAAEARGRDNIRDTHAKLKAEEKIAIYKASRKITWDRFKGREFRFCISWSWDDPQKYDILEAVRDIPGRSYEPYHWGVPVSSELSVREFAEKWDFDDSALPEMKVDHLRVVPEPTVEYVEPAFPLYPHQNEGIDYLRANKKAFLTDEMGLGKTIQALMALPSATAALVVCPASLKGNWAREVKTWRPDLTPVILSGKGSFRWPCLGEIVIVNYELFPKEGEASYLNWEVNAIVDEAHYLKKSKAARTKKWRAISRDILEAGGSTWGMTGTPLVTTPYDLYGCLQSFGLLKQGYGSYNNFVSVWGGHKGHYGLLWSPNRINEKLAQEGLAKCSFGRKRIDVLPDLPSKRWTEIEVKLPKGCGAIDRDSMDELEAWANGGPTPVAGKIAEARKKLAITKGKKALPFIDELIQGGGGPVVVFSAHVQPCQELGKYDRWECITGDTPAEKRAEIVERFQNGELDGLAGTVGAMGVGLTLTKSCRMIFLDLPWSNSEIAQAEDRICRIGQKNACEYFLITSNSEVDQIIHKSITRKTKMTDNVDAVRSN
jgi:SNF2 family DNA or RNA helicase